MPNYVPGKFGQKASRVPATDTPFQSHWRPRVSKSSSARSTGSSCACAASLLCTSPQSVRDLCSRHAPCVSPQTSVHKNFGYGILGMRANSPCISPCTFPQSVRNLLAHGRHALCHPSRQHHSCQPGGAASSLPDVTPALYTASSSLGATR